MNSSPKRTYASSARDRQARATRRAVLDAATELFLAEGYAATSVAAVARRAGVSAQTVYNGFGTKKDLLKAAYDRTLAGDDEPVALAGRPEVQALQVEPDAGVMLLGYAALGRSLLERVGPLLLQISAGAVAGDPDLVELQATTDAERLAGTGMVVRRVAELGALRDGLTVDQARDRIWALNSVGLWHLLTQVRGWSGDDYAQFIGDALCAAVLEVR